MYLAVIITIEFATFYNASANASAANPERSKKSERHTIISTNAESKYSRGETLAFGPTSSKS